MGIEIQPDDQERAFADLRGLVDEGNKNPIQPMSAEAAADWKRQLDERAARPAAGSVKGVEATDEDNYINGLKSNPEHCKEVFKENAEAFVQAEITAGATLQELARTHAGHSRAKGPEADRFELSRRALYGIYGNAGGVKISEATFDNAITNIQQTGGETLNERIRGNVMLNQLSYRDANIPEQEKANALRFVRDSDSGRKYADALIEMTKTHNVREFENVAQKMVEECRSVLGKLGIRPTPYTDSKTWGMWDIGKQYYFLLHPDENDPKYRIADPIADSGKHAEIVHRHVGWEVYAAWRRGEKDFLERTPEKTRNQIVGYLEREPKHRGTLSSDELAELGSLLNV